MAYIRILQGQSGALRYHWAFGVCDPEGSVWSWETEKQNLETKDEQYLHFRCWILSVTAEVWSMSLALCVWGMLAKLNTKITVDPGYYVWALERRDSPPIHWANLKFIRSDIFCSVSILLTCEPVWPEFGSMWTVACESPDTCLGRRVEGTGFSQ